MTSWRPGQWSWTAARKASKPCDDCGRRTREGDRILYRRVGDRRDLLCDPCGRRQEARDGRPYAVHRSLVAEALEQREAERDEPAPAPTLARQAEVYADNAEREVLELERALEDVRAALDRARDHLKLFRANAAHARRAQLLADDFAKN